MATRTLRRMGLLLLLLASAAAVLVPPTPASAAGAGGVALGFSHTCLLTGEGTMKCWGMNESGQLGNGSVGSSDPNPLPGHVLEEPGGASLAGASAVSAGIAHTCAIVGGGAKCWGKNIHGQLGDGQACGTTCASPVDVPGLTSGVAAISADGNHTCAVTETGAVQCWGLNHAGQLGAPTTELCTVLSLPCSTTPVGVTGLDSGAVAVDAGLEHSCALLETGGVKCWGKNHAGQLGNGTIVDSISPVDVCQQYDASSQTCVALLSGVVAVTLGIFHGCALVVAEPPAADYGVQCWGTNELGQLGNGACCSVGLRSTTPVSVSGLSSGVSTIVAGHNHNCASLQSTGGASCWGANSEGQVGDGTAISPRATPVDVTRLAGRATSLGAGGGHSCAVLEAGGVQCWGANAGGQIGDGTTTRRTTAAHVALDSDRDGCLDAVELQTAVGSQTAGGLRDPKNFWDFFDTPNQSNERDRSVDVGDISRIIARFGATGDADIDPLSPPPAAGYHTAFDRTVLGPNLWNLGPPNASVNVQDISLVVAQFGHTCL